MFKYKGLPTMIYNPLIMTKKLCKIKSFIDVHLLLLESDSKLMSLFVDRFVDLLTDG